MIKSIRRFLLLTLLIAITITTTITIAGNYYFDQEDIQYHLDTLLNHAAFSYSALIKASLKTENFATIQKSFMAVPQKDQLLFDQSKNTTVMHHFENKYVFQVWN